MSLFPPGQLKLLPVLRPDVWLVLAANFTFHLNRLLITGATSSVLFISWLRSLGELSMSHESYLQGALESASTYNRICHRSPTRKLQTVFTDEETASERCLNLPTSHSWLTAGPTFGTQDQLNLCSLRPFTKILHLPVRIPLKIKITSQLGN